MGAVGGGGAAHGDGAGSNGGAASRAALLRFVLRATTAGFFLVGAILIGGRLNEGRHWPAVLGTIQELRLEESGAGEDGATPGTQYRIRAGYSYEIDGVSYEGTRLTVYDWVYRNEERAGAWLTSRGLAPGARVPVYYDPEEPERALLVPGIPWNRLEVILGLLLLGVLPVAVVVFSVVDLLRGGASRREDRSRGRFW